MDEGTSELRWARRPALARALRTALFAMPVLLSFAAAWATSTLLPPSTGLLDRAGSLAALGAVSTVVLVLLDRLSRRALPLATLLDLSMLFPDRAPSRLGVAREAIRRRPIEEQLRRVRAAGADPSAVAREILTLVAALSKHDRPTRGHAERVRLFTDLLAEQLRVPARDRDLLRWAAILHDIGKLRVPTTLLNKPGKPTTAEWALLKAHPAHGADIAAALLPWLGDWADVILQHHERYDGTGYPTGLAGRQISLGARIVSVADAYDVMTAARAYKRPVSRRAALKELVRHSGSQFDPVVVRAMVDVGAPRLRRAQGVLAWLADIPLVAGGAVPAATVARVVGAGAVATGVVTGGLPPGAGLETWRPPSATVEAVGAQDRPAVRAASAAEEDAVSPPAGLQTQADRRPGARVGNRVGSPGGPTDPGSSGSGSSGSGSGSGSSGSGSDSSGSPGPGTTPPTDDPVGTVTDTTRTVVDTLGDAADDPVGTVDDTLSDPVGTVDDAVTVTSGTVTGVVRGVLGGSGSGSGGSGSGSGGSGPSPAPSPSPSSPSSGLLGGVLGLD